MKTDKLVDAIGMIKDEFIKEAHEKEKKSFVFPWALAGKLAVAGLCLLLVVNVVPSMFRKSSDSSYNSASGIADEGYYGNSATSSYEYSPSEPMTDNYKTDGEDESSTSVIDSLKDANKKLILNANMKLESQSLDETMDSILKATEKYGGYVQNSSLYSQTTYTRVYDATIRIPADQYSNFIEEIKTQGNTLSYSERVDDVTDMYTDISARLTSLKAQEAKVMEFYQKAQTIEDLMAVEERLSDIRYQIEAYEAQIKNYDLLVAYSTLNVTVTETKTYTTTPVGFFDRLAKAFTNGFTNFTNSIGDFIIDFVYNIWTIIFLVVLGYLGYRLYRRFKNRKNK